MSPIEELLSVMRRLRDPDEGCAWDVKQTFATIAPYTIEEAYEVADAIERDNIHDLKDELGDLLLQVVFHAQMADEQNAFNFEDVASGIVAKLIRRHPHVFGDAKNASADEVKAIWESIKETERAEKGQVEDQSALGGVTLGLPALVRADKLQGRAARVGFDWPDVTPVWDKLSEEIAETREAVAEKNNDAIEDEMGDLLFTVVNLSRHLKVDPEQALRRANAKFDSRFRRVEALAGNRNAELQSLSLEELDALWDEAKRHDQT